MTDDEKELEQKFRQYQYENEENKKKMKRLQQDSKKIGKKSFTYIISKAVGRTFILYEILFYAVLILAALIILKNIYITRLGEYDPIKPIEEKYDMKFEIISREADNKILEYNVKPKKWKYRKVKFTIVQIGTGNPYDDFRARYLKYMIENIEPKELLEGFEIKENYQEYNILEYKLIYTVQDNDESIAIQKINNLRNYILQLDENIYKTLRLDELIMKTDTSV